MASSKKQKTSHNGGDEVVESKEVKKSVVGTGASKDDDDGADEGVREVKFEFVDYGIAESLELIRNGQYQKVKKVTICFQEWLDMTSEGRIKDDEKIAPLFEAIGNLPKLESVVIEDLGEFACLSLDNVTRLLSQRPNSLREFRMRECFFWDSFETKHHGVEEFAEALKKQQKSLVHFEYSRIYLMGRLDADGNQGPEYDSGLLVNYDKVLSALATMKKLETVHWNKENCYTLGTELPEDVLKKLCGISTLKELDLSCFRRHGVITSHTLGNLINFIPRLRVLHLAFCNVADKSEERAALMKLLAENETLEELHIFPPFHNTVGQSVDDLLLEIAESLQHNKTLKRFKIDFSQQIQTTDKSGKAIVKLLETQNTTLESFEVLSWGAEYAYYQSHYPNTCFSPKIQCAIEKWSGKNARENARENARLKKEQKKRLLEAKVADLEIARLEKEKEKLVLQGKAADKKKRLQAEVDDLEIAQLEEKKKQLLLQADVAML